MRVHEDLLMFPLDISDPLVLLAFTVNSYCRFKASLNLTLVRVIVEDIFRSMSPSVMTSPVFLSVRVISALHTGELCQQKELGN